jgi:hypothetical protein
MKNFFNKKQFNNIFVIILICFFLFLIIYQLYLAINNDKFRGNYSKLVEGFKFNQINPQSPIDCSSNNLSAIYNAVVIDISNIGILYNDVNNINIAVNGLITDTSFNDASLNTITSTTIPSSSSDVTQICIAVNANMLNIPKINNNILSIYNVVTNISNGQTTTFNSLTANNKVHPVSPASSVKISNLCQAENINIKNINALNANALSLNSLVNRLQNNRTNQMNSQANSAMSLSNAVGISS